MAEGQAIRFDSTPELKQIEELVQGEDKPKVIIIGQADAGRMTAVAIACALKAANVPLIVGDVGDVTDEEILKLVDELPETTLGVGTDVRRNIAALEETPVMKLEALPNIHTYDIGAEEKASRRKKKKQDKNRQRHFNRNQKLPKGRF